MRRSFPLWILLTLLILATGFYFVLRKAPPTPELTPELTPPPPRLGPALSELASPPDWSTLDPLQETLSRATFLRDLRSTYALPGAWEATMKLSNEGLTIARSTHQAASVYSLTFAENDPPLSPLPPIDQIHIAIDPGHIGGDFAELEARNFDPTPNDHSDRPVREGDLTLATARHLKPLLEAMGAKVTLVRNAPEPVTKERPSDFLPHHPNRLKAEKLFYRTAEIRARGKLVNETIKPDLVLALHYNADAWNGDNPWAQRNHFHLILHGAYMKEEIALDDQRAEMTRHILTRTTARALPLARAISDTFLAKTGLTPYNYHPNAPALLVDPVRPIYARNLLANRIYECPTIYLEPYVMNHREVFERVQLGDYEGTRSINGQDRLSLVREYAETLAEALRLHFLDKESEMDPLSKK